MQYGKVKIGGMDEDQAVAAIRQHFVQREFEPPQVSVQLLQSSGMQPITGEHLVAPDGSVNLGTYGSVDVAGMTLPEAKTAIETQLANYLDSPQVSVSVFAYNSKVYYVITEGAGQGDLVARLPITGNETVLDAISQINGLSRISSKNIWIARPTESGVRLRHDPAGQLERDHQGRRHGHQLSGAARRSDLHRREQADRLRRRAQPAHRALRTHLRRHLARYPNHPNHQPLPTRYQRTRRRILEEQERYLDARIALVVKPFGARIDATTLDPPDDPGLRTVAEPGIDERGTNPGNV